MVGVWKMSDSVESADMSADYFTGLPGVYPGATRALSDALRYIHSEGGRRAAAEGLEIGGLLVTTPKDWTPEMGWTADVEFTPLLNETGEVGSFVISAGSVSDMCGLRMDLRSAVALRVCERYGWDGGASSWADVVSYRVRNSPSVLEEVRAETEFLDREARRAGASWDGDFPVTFESVLEARVNAGLEDVREQLKSCFAGAEGGAGALPHISAWNYLMMTGPRMLSGIVHTHPSGAATTSPHDLVALDIWAEYQYAFAFGSEQLPGYDGGMEKLVNAGNWIFSLREGGWADSAVRYTRRGPVTVVTPVGGFRQITEG